MVKWTVGALLVAAGAWFLGPTSVAPILVALSVAWLLARLANRSDLWRKAFDGRSTSTQLLASLGIIALIGTGGGIAGYFGMTLLSTDPCLSDWDIECSSQAAERLSSVQVVFLPVVFLGWAAFMATIPLGAVMAFGSLYKRHF